MEIYKLITIFLLIFGFIMLIIALLLGIECDLSACEHVVVIMLSIGFPVVVIFLFILAVINRKEDNEFPDTRKYIWTRCLNGNTL